MPTSKVTNTIRKIVGVDPIMFVILISSAIVLAVSIFVQFKNTHDVKEVLEESTRHQLLSTAAAAREIIDVDRFVSYGSREEVLADSADYYSRLAELRRLARNSGATYIYAVKKINGVPFFIFDTDEEDDTLFEEYEGIEDVHEKAFTGIDAVGIMNVQDEWGNFSSSAIPLYNSNNKVVGIVSVDIEDAYIKKSNDMLMKNAILLISIMSITLLVVIYLIYKLVIKVLKVQDELTRMAHFDTITNLPSRQYLMNYLQKKTTVEKGQGFAILFIDLDNFKKVNDNAGHDAGDIVLKKIADYLQESAIKRTPVPVSTTSISEKSISFRIAPGMLNVAARVGGDEFIHVVRDVNTEEEAAKIAKDLLDGFQEIRNTDEIIQKYGVGLSIGVALYPKHSENYHVLIKYADIAMYKSKKSGKNNYAVYSVGMDSEKDA